MKIRSLISAFSLVLTLILAAPAMAAPVTYDLVNVSFIDGGTASGSFTYDASIQTFTGWSITTTPTVFPGGYNANGDQFINGASYTTNGFSNANSANYLNSFGLNIQDSAASFPDRLNLVFSGLTDAGGTFAITMGSESGGFSTRKLVSGSISSVPLPASLLLFGTAIIAFAAFGSRCKARAEA